MNTSEDSTTPATTLLARLAAEHTALWAEFPGEHGGLVDCVRRLKRRADFAMAALAKAEVERDEARAALIAGPLMET